MNASGNMKKPVKSVNLLRELIGDERVNEKLRVARQLALRRKRGRLK